MLRDSIINYPITRLNGSHKERKSSEKDGWGIVEGKEQKTKNKNMGWMGDFSIIISVLNKNKFLFFSFIYENKEINNKNLNIIANLNNKNKLCWLKSYEIVRYLTITNCPLTPRFPKKKNFKDEIGNIMKNIIYWNIMAVRIKTQ